MRKDRGIFIWKIKFRKYFLNSYGMKNGQKASQGKIYCLNANEILMYTALQAVYGLLLRSC